MLGVVRDAAGDRLWATTGPWHTTESPWEQATWVEENSRTCGVRARCLLVTRAGADLSAAWYQANHDGS